ncbi:MAG: hypothetical protein KDD03_11780, partial [Gelidibacter sp.]|nr:hypothetical protein [Gelidibacter sp.]
MAYNINLNSTQEFSTSASNSFTQNPWSFSPFSGLYTDYVIGNGTPASINIGTTIFNYIAANLGYESYNIKSSVQAGQPGDFLDDIMVLSGEIASAQPTGYVLTEENLEVTNTLT